MPLLLWNPSAVSYLAQLVLAAAIAGYFLHRVVVRRRLKQPSGVLIWLFVAVASQVPVAGLSILRATLPPSDTAYALPWMAPIWAVSICAQLQFAYLFPQKLPAGKIETWCARIFSLAFIAHETWIGAARQFDTLREGLIWFRPSEMDIWVMAGTAWTAVVLSRQVLYALRDDEPAAYGVSQTARFFSTLRRLNRIGGNREAAAGAAYFAFAMLPLTQALIYFLRARGLLDNTSTEIATAWIMLTLLCGFALAFLNYMPEHSSFQIKLAGVGMTAVLAAIVATSWLIGPAYIDAFRCHGCISERQSFRFKPDGKGGYLVSKMDYQFDAAAGQAVDLDTGKVDLPFVFPFYQKTYKTIFVREDGMASFLVRQTWADAQFRHGRIPAIVPMAVELGGTQHDAIGPGSGVFVNTAPDKTTITWLRLHGTMAPAQRYTFQVVLHPDGTIDMSYAEVPNDVKYSLYEPHASPWMTGITPGYFGGAVRLISLRNDLPFHAPPDAGVMQDDYIAFLRHVDKGYAPIAMFMMVAVLLIVLALPVFLRVSLVQPLNRLLGAVEAFRGGNLQASVPVTFHDEIGYLTSSFNEMAMAQHDLVETLEDRVVRRTAQIAKISDRNARLEERVSLSSDLHDTVSQTLFSAAMLADTLPAVWRKDRRIGEQTLGRLAGLHRQALAEMRDLLTELRAQGAAEAGFGQRLSDLANHFKVAHLTPVSVEITGDAALPGDVQAMFYRIAQEGLNNVVKHARAQNVHVTYEGLAGQAMLNIRDDGRGFDPSKVAAGRLGLQIMGERAERIGAVLEIESSPGKGTALTLIWLPDHG